MSIAALSAPQSQEDFELTVEPLWTELEGRNLDELTSEVIAGHLLQVNVDALVQGRNTGSSMASALRGAS